MTMPNPGTALHIAVLDYYCTFGKLQAATGPVTFAVPDPVRFTFTFDTGSTPNQDGSVTVTSDSSWFVQATVETGIATALNTISAAVGTLLGLTTAQVQAAVAVKRVWTIAPVIQGPGFSSGSTAITNMMAYP
jgi:hypothetical protein